MAILTVLDKPTVKVAPATISEELSVKEFRELANSGFLKREIVVQLEDLTHYDEAYRPGNLFHFQFQQKHIATFLNDIDVQPEGSDSCKVIFRFALRSSIR